ncbi:MAG: hypothetical protein US52_C0003G0007 [candidate division WS6 bacterium GW2011_GWA2_37_6]|uniref:PrgI family protein n=1 Tax=candidate division WS6 bacterium GW2011_GWA2_37_6 TaxID=1619087 RepID=A0A0G0K6K9_9BACT|nr:MAG: hypothetical protein US52_C0003G0007 [candidate division WS6 bacterium GW2011_GWA2_37_6]
MEKHAIPQNIMQVEFKLFGSLTIKQFFSLAGGIVLAVLIYFLSLPIIIGWPLIIISVAIGFALAFVTINGQPFSRWFGNFIVAIFASQKYVWHKTVETPKSLQQSVQKIKPSTKSNVKKELGIAPIVEVVQRKNIQLDASEQQDLARLDKYFEAEFDKYKAYNYAQAGNKEPSRRVNPSQQNIAGEINPLGRKQNQVRVGDNEEVVYTNFSNQKARPVSVEEEDVLIEKKVREILEKQRRLTPLLETAELEEREKRLKTEMRKLYNQIQELKK